MKQTKQFLRPLLMAIVMLVGMLVPQGAWAQYLWVDDGETVTISEDASYDGIDVDSGGELIINEGVTLTVTVWLNINGNDINDLYGTVINYGAIIGEGQIHLQGGVLANHGHIDLDSASGNGTFYNTGTLGGGYFNLTTTPCDHDYENFTVEATCTHGAGTQYRCKTCYYMRLDETSGALPHSFDSHNGINICTSCGHTTYDEPANGDGSEEDPYQIANAANLYWFADYTINENNYANAILTADIVLNDGTFATDGTFTATGADEPSKPFPWICIGGADGYYYGTFDGNGHTISGMYVNGSFGLFYTLDGSVVNLGIVNCYIRLVSNYDTGAICHLNAGTISNCYTTGILSGSYSSGICDVNTGGSTISNCYSTCSFVYDTDFYGGGICHTNNGTISNCYTSDNTAIQYNRETASEVYGGVSADRFASGEIAYKLNGSVDGEGNWTAGATDGTQKWYQKLGENGDSYPVLAAAEGNTVYEQKTIDCGGTVVACNYYNTEEEDVTQPHDYHVQLDENENPVFVWSEDCTTATLQLVCSHNAEHTSSVDADMVSWVSNPATCTTTGVHAYSATVEYDGQTYADYKNVEIDIDPNAHDIGVGIELVAVYYDDIIKYINRQELMPETDVSMRCKECGRELFLDDTESISGYSITYEITMDPNCWRNGFYNFNLEINIPSGDIYSFSKNSNIYALGHSYGEEMSLCSDGYHHYVCTREECGDLSEDKYAKMFGEYSEVTEDAAPTASIQLTQVGTYYYTSLYTDFPYKLSDDVEAYSAVVEVAENTITLEGGSNSVPANCGVILKGDVSQCTIEYDPEGFENTAPEDNLLTGSTTAITAPNNNQYAFGLSNEGYLGFWRWPNMTIPAWKAYLDLGEEASGARGFRIVFDDETNGIQQLPADASAIEGSYDLMGHKVREVKGLGIVNGKKVFVNY